MPIYLRVDLVTILFFFLIGIRNSFSFAGTGGVSNETEEATNKSRTSLENEHVLRSFPFHGIGVPLDVLIAGIILDVEDINCFKMEFKVSLVLNQTWRDSRVVHSNTSGTKVQLDSKNTLVIWTPDIFIRNGRDASSTHSGVMRTPDGRFVKSDRITVTSKCHMSFGLYPFDHHHCFLEIQSRYWNEDEVHLGINVFEKEHGQRKGLQLDPRFTTMAPFHVVDVNSEVSSSSFNNENYSQVLVGLRFRRLWSSYFGTFYLSMASFVSLSLLSLWLVYPRISAIVNCFNIGLINIFLVLYKSNLDIPKVYYVTSMEIYSGVCVMFVVLVLLVNIYVLYYVKAEEEEEEVVSEQYWLGARLTFDSIAEVMRRIRREHQSLEFNGLSGTRRSVARITSQSTHHSPQTTDGSFSEDTSNLSPSNWKIIKSNLMDKVRRNSHWTLLFGFIVFNAVYWVVMLTMHYAF